MALRFVVMHTLLGAPPSPGCPPGLVDLWEVGLNDSFRAISVERLEKVRDILDRWYFILNIVKWCLMLYTSRCCVEFILGRLDSGSAFMYFPAWVGMLANI